MKRSLNHSRYAKEALEDVSLLYVKWLIPALINCGVHLCGAHAQLMSSDEQLVQGTSKPALSLFL
jgi:hypothetical protein